MNAPAAFKATYSDLRFIKSRKVATVSLELPIEQADAFVKAFGTPNPASETWVAIARLDPEKTKDPVKENRSFGELPRSQRAALLCKTKAFQTYLGGESEDAVAENIRRTCKIASRSELDTWGDAAAIFDRLERNYQDWLSEPVI